MSHPGSAPRPSAVDDDERLARAALTRIGEPGHPRLTGLVHRLGASAVLAALRSGDLGPDLDRALASRLAATDPERDLQAAAKVGARLVCPGDDEWPVGVEDLERPEPINGRGGVPVALWVRGPHDLSELCRRSVAVVGSRASSSYGDHVAGELGADLADRGVTVVSGAAYGIDAAAHRGCLAVDGLTVAVLACGVDQAYPQGHAAMLARIANDGLVVSELPPGAPPSRLRFLARNRVIAALVTGTVVVEAAWRSGALSTASWSSALHRLTMAVPGPVTSPTSAGVHRLIRSGKADLVDGVDAVVETISPIGEGLAPLPSGEVRSRDGLDPQVQQVLDAVPVLRPRGVGGIATEAGLDVDDALAALGQLLLADLVERCGSGWRLSARERAALRAREPRPAAAEPVPG